MALLSFPPTPTPGELYPNVPLVGQPQYRWDAPNQTWVLEGVATGVAAGCYGSATSVPAICVDTQGRITSAVDVPISAVTPDLQTVTTQGAVSTDVITVGGLIAAGLSYPSTDGAADQVLATDGAGNLGWVTTLKVVAPPTASTDPGNPGEVSAAPGFFYFYDGTQWLQVAGSVF